MLPAPLEESGTTSRLLRMRVRFGVGLVVALCVAGLSACGGGERQDEDEAEGEFPVEITAAEFPAKQSLAQATELVLSVENAGDETIPNLAVTIFTVADEDESAGEADAAAVEEQLESGDSGDGEDDLAEAVEQELQEELEDAGSDDEEAQTEAELTVDEDAQLSVAEGSFSTISLQPGLASPSRPVWILEQGYPTLVGAEIPPGPPGELAAASPATAVQTNTFAWGVLEPGDDIDMVWKVTAVQPGTYTVHYRVAAGLQGNAVAVTDDGGDPEGEFVVQITDAPPQTRVNEAGKVVPIKPGDVIGQVGRDAGGSGGSGNP
ncbi:MAG: hypothetical protein K0S15_506 [Solirubrobacterales bacterium]|jgi:hypothetical protein|nr:hypothetical protein [Solirubrobacterales bacterium]